jgi:hypothetical protein
MPPVDSGREGRATGSSPQDASACHGISCDPTEAIGDIAYQADDGWLTPWGCPDCAPRLRAPHVLDCEPIGWHGPMSERLNRIWMRRP